MLLHLLAHNSVRFIQSEACLANTQTRAPADNPNPPAPPPLEIHPATADVVLGYIVEELRTAGTTTKNGKSQGKLIALGRAAPERHFGARGPRAVQETPARLAGYCAGKMSTNA